MAQQTDSFEFKDENARFGIKDEWMNKPHHIGGQKQQTAVEWLTQQVKSKEWQDMFIWHKEEIFKQAKQMEKEQIMKAVYNSMGTNFDPNMGRAELYYNETYGKSI